MNIDPREVEEVIFRHPEVADVALIGGADDRWGEVLKAFVVRRAGSSLDEAALVAALEGQISRMKLPKHVEFIAQIPRNASGKVLKTALRARG